MNWSKPLGDPRFNVRYEAIISIARTPSHPRLTSALIEILNGTELSLSNVSAWALGRIGDPEAVAALRDRLDSDYRSVQAHCARALGTLKDEVVRPPAARTPQSGGRQRLADGLRGSTWQPGS